MSELSSLEATPQHFWKLHQDLQRPDIQIWHGVCVCSDPLGVRKSTVVRTLLGGLEMFQVPRASLGQSLPSEWEELSPPP